MPGLQHLSRRRMVLLEPDPFLNELTKLFERTRSLGTVWVTMKRSTMKPVPKKPRTSGTLSAAESAAEEDFRCLVRATDGKKKFSTAVTGKDQARFQAAYATVLRAHMSALKKRDKKDKRKAPKAAAAPA